MTSVRAKIPQIVWLIGCLAVWRYLRNLIFFVLFFVLTARYLKSISVASLLCLFSRIIHDPYKRSQ